MIVSPNSTSVLITILALDSDGNPLTGAAFGTFTLKYLRDGASAATAITLSAGVLGTWSSGGLAEVGYGVYELGLPDAAVVSGARKVSIIGTNSSGLVVPETVDLLNLSAGPGSRSLTWTTKRSGTPVANVEAWITADSSGLNVVGGTYITDDSGIARVPGGTGLPMIDDDVTYYGWRDSPTNQFTTNPIQFRYSSADSEFQLYDGSSWDTWDGVSNDASTITGGSSSTSYIVTAGVLIKVYKSEGITKDLTILKANGDTIIPQTNDKIRVRIGREGRTAKLTVSSDGATDNGSTFTKGGGGGAKNRLRLDASDLTFASGVYTMWFDMFDAEDANEWKLVSKHIFVLEE